MKQEGISRIDDIPQDVDTDQNPDFVNILRQRTFNDELRSLVVKIREHKYDEDDNELPETVSKPEPADDASQLLKSLHGLFYRVKNINCLPHINTSMNPITLIKSKITDNASLSSFVGEELSKISIPYFSVLTYNIYKRGFFPEITNITHESAQNIIISPRSEFYSRIRNKKNGLLMTSSEIQSDLFSCKIFNPVIKSLNDSSVYFILASSLVREISDGSRDYYTDDLSPVLMFVCEKTETQTSAELKQEIIKKISLPLLSMLSPVNLDFKPNECTSMLQLTLKLDHYLQIYSKKADGFGIVIKSSDYYDKKILIVFKYLYTKLIKIVSNDSFIIRIQKNIIIVFTHENYINDIKAVIDEYNELFKNSFSMDSFALSFFDNFNMLTEKIYS